MSQPANFWRHEETSVGEEFTVTTPILDNPVPPTDVDVQNAVTPLLNQGIGEFVRQVVDAGYTITIQDYGYGYYFEFIRTITPTPRSPYKSSIYQFHLTWYVEFTTNMPHSSLDSRGLFPVILTFILVIAVILTAGLLAFEFIKRITTQTTVNEEWGWVQNPNTGIWERVLIKRSTSTGPPDWWAWVMPIVALGGIALIFPSLITGVRDALKKEPRYVQRAPYPGE